MADNLVIVESPAKAKTIEKYLGKEFEVIASYGHVRDLLPKKGSVEPDNGFVMHYELIDKNKKHIDAMIKAIKKASSLYLAPDPDREGEAIAWHIYEILQEKKALKNKAIHRIVFHEITKTAIQKALAEPRSIDMRLVNAQQARRALDYLVGFNLSPLLWRKITAGLSAGRVQSPALRLIVEREAEIEKFQTQEYWTLEAACAFQNHAFSAKLIQYQHQKLEQFSITNETQAKEAEADILQTAKGQLTVSTVEKKLKKRYPAAPFITSTLQQEAARKLGFSAKKTMVLAQQLYEGIEVGMGSAGLITYMRTDSVNLAQEAIASIRDFIARKYGKENVPPQPNFYKTKSKNAQEAHEAIRPTAIDQTPEMLGGYLSKDQYKLYELIWKRTLACQMIYATLHTVSVDLVCGSHTFRATGSTIVTPGFIRVYQEDYDDKKIAEEDSEKLLPELKSGDTVTLDRLDSAQHFTEPPPRYTEASLIKTLEEYGIGRPSTYASIISTLQDRQYATLDKKRFYPTDRGKIVNQFLTKYFTKYIDYHFTANLEDELDGIARGEVVWEPVLKKFWEPFHTLINHIDKTVERKDVTQEKLDEACPKCSKPLLIRLGRNGRFIGCSGYPECDYTRDLKASANEAAQPAELIEGRVCPKCGKPLAVKQGRYGKFIACTGYPDCKYIESLNKPEDTHIACPECEKGTLTKRKSRYGKFFYSCSRYPDCKYAIWNEPISESCPKCHRPILTLKITKRYGTQKVCPQKTCGYIQNEDGSTNLKAAVETNSSDTPPLSAKKRTPRKRKSTAVK